LHQRASLPSLDVIIISRYFPRLLSFRFFSAGSPFAFQRITWSGKTLRK